MNDNLTPEAVEEELRDARIGLEASLLREDTRMVGYYLSDLLYAAARIAYWLDSEVEARR